MPSERRRGGTSRAVSRPTATASSKSRSSGSMARARSSAGLDGVDVAGAERRRRRPPARRPARAARAGPRGARASPGRPGGTSALTSSAMPPPISASSARANVTPSVGGCSVATSAAETAACWANIWPEPSSSATVMASATTSAELPRARAEHQDEQVAHRDAQRHADDDLHRPAPALAEREPERDDRRDRGEERLGVADHLRGDEPRADGRERDLRDGARRRASARSARTRADDARALGRLLEQGLGAIGSVRDGSATPVDAGRAVRTST